MNMNQAAALRKNGQAGFTLIELIVVIVILGILAATALPKFSNLSGDARVATLNAAKGSLLSVSSMTHGSYLVNGGTSVVMEGTTVTLSNGYPTAAQNTLDAAGLATTDYKIITATTATSTAPAAPASGMAIVPASVFGTAKSLTCYITYTQATSTTTGGVTTVTPPVVDTTNATSAGCV